MHRSYKEENFLSAVIVARNYQAGIIERLSELDTWLASNFNNYEIVVVDNFSSDLTLDLLKKSDLKLTIIELSRRHNVQQALRAGVDISIGDFILEIEDIAEVDDFNVIQNLYSNCLEGHDFVFYSPRRTRLLSKLFYLVINRYFKNSFSGDISSAIMVISSRRGQNKTVEAGNLVVNRNIAYILTGLKYQSVFADIRIKKRKRGSLEDIDLFVDTLIHYTDLIPILATIIASLFFLTSFIFLIYSFTAYFIIGTVEGWASTNTFLAFSFSGVFLMLAFISKYLLNVLNISKKRKQYVYRSITKN